jgi:hypothetical protein
MPDPGLWALMQRVETLHYRAERLEKAAPYLPEPWREEALLLAGRWREIADQLDASSRSRAA